jgi:sterol desaturase/sphingolipid hydroxylase (fatty acid hydroxylase superfamily)
MAHSVKASGVAQGAPRNPHTANTTQFNHSDVPIRLFKSDFLEFFTHISPVVVMIIWTPVILFFLARSIVQLSAGQSWLFIPAGFLVGVFLWTFAEYSIHRFVFHFDPESERVAKIWFMFHGVHHAQPQLKTRLVMPPILSIPGAILFYFLFYFLVGKLLGAPQWVDPVFAGFITGYLVYDMTHYATHHWPMRSGVGKYLKRYHMMHHFKTPQARYGVSSPMWDAVFRTKPNSK